MPFRLHSANPETGQTEYLWIDETSRIMIHGTDASYESMREAKQNFSIEVRYTQMLSVLAGGVIYQFRVMDEKEVDPRILECLKQEPRLRTRLTSYTILHNRIVKQGDQQEEQQAIE